MKQLHALLALPALLMLAQLPAQHLLSAQAPAGTVNVRVLAGMIDGEFNIDAPHQNLPGRLFADDQGGARTERGGFDWPGNRAGGRGSSPASLTRRSAGGRGPARVVREGPAPFARRVPLLLALSPMTGRRRADARIHRSDMGRR